MKFLNLPNEIQLHIYEKYLNYEDRCRLNIALCKHKDFLTKDEDEKFKSLGIISQAIRNNKVKITPKIKDFINNNFSRDETEVAFLCKEFPCITEKNKEPITLLINEGRFEEEDMVNIMSETSDYNTQCIDFFASTASTTTLTPKAFDLALKYLDTIFTHDWDMRLFYILNYRNEVLLRHISINHPQLLLFEHVSLFFPVFLGFNDFKTILLVFKYFDVPDVNAEFALNCAIQNVDFKSYNQIKCILMLKSTN